MSLPLAWDIYLLGSEFQLCSLCDDSHLLSEDAQDLTRRGCSMGCLANLVNTHAGCIQEAGAGICEAD